MFHSTDIAIVGAGPAGAWAAYNLARRGARVTIFDRSHPREKPCGGGVTGRALALVGGAIAESSLPTSSIHRARFVDTSAGRSAVVPLTHLWDPPSASAKASADRRSLGEGWLGGLIRLKPDPTALVVASRMLFDAALLDAARRAGATLVPARVSDVALDASGVRIDLAGGGHARARFLIGADGANSLVRRRLAHPFRREELSIATGYFVHGATSDEIVIELLSDPAGYIWSFPRPDHLAIGICAQADAGITAEGLRERTARWIRETGIANATRLQSYSWPIPSLTAGRLQQLELAGSGWCTVGDAAGLVDPITREGIYFALLSGEWAAEAALTGNASQYAARVRAEILPELARAARLKAGFFKLTSTGLIIRALQHSAGIGEVMADLIAGRQGYSGLNWRLLRTLEWRLAWQVLGARSSTREVSVAGANSHVRPGDRHVNRPPARV